MPTKEQIEAIIKELKPILRLSNWEIDFDYCDEYRLKDLTGKSGSVGCCESNLQINYAHIYIDKGHKQINEWYYTLAHELFHLVTDDWRYHSRALLDYIQDETTRDKERNMLITYYEQATDSLAKIFCTVYPVSNFDQILKTEEVAK